MLTEKEEKLANWEKEQNALKQLLDETDTTFVESDIKYIAGVDISFVAGAVHTVASNDATSQNDACAAIVVCAASNTLPVYRNTKMVRLTEEYIPGFLAFREVPHLINLLAELKSTDDQVMPNLIFVDGNGKLHPRGFGLACHLGVLTGIPTIGIGKNLHHIDGLDKDTVIQKFRKECVVRGDYIKLVGDSGTIWGAAVKTSSDAINPVYVSVGHKVSLDTAVKLTLKYSRFRVPEPIRFADHESREYIRIHHSG